MTDDDAIVLDLDVTIKHRGVEIVVRDDLPPGTIRWDEGEECARAMSMARRRARYKAWSAQFSEYQWLAEPTPQADGHP